MKQFKTLLFGLLVAGTCNAWGMDTLKKHPVKASLALIATCFGFPGYALAPAWFAADGLDSAISKENGQMNTPLDTFKERPLQSSLVVLASFTPLASVAASLLGNFMCADIAENVVTTIRDEVERLDPLVDEDFQLEDNLIMLSDEEFEDDPKPSSSSSTSESETVSIADLLEDDGDFISNLEDPDNFIPLFLGNNPLNKDPIEIAPNRSISTTNTLGFDDEIVQYIPHGTNQDDTLNKLYFNEVFQNKINDLMTVIQTNPANRAIYAIFDGPSGVGKTTVARTIAHESGCDFLGCCATNLAQKYVGEAPRLVRKIFSKAIGLNRPVVIFIDELDKPLKNDRTNEYSNACATLWDLMYRHRNNKNIIFILAVNDYDILPIQLKNRFINRITFELPNSEECKQVLQLKYKEQKLGKKLRDDVVRYYAPRLVGLCNRDIENIVQQMVQKQHWTRTDLEQAIKQKRIDNKLDGKGIVQSCKDSITSLWTDTTPVQKLQLLLLCADANDRVPKGTFSLPTIGNPHRRR